MRNLSANAGIAAAPRSSGGHRGDRDRRYFLAELYEAHWERLCRYLRTSFGAGPPEPEDVAQVAFTKFAALDSCEQVENPRAYLYTTARNYVIDERRRARQRERYTQQQRIAADTEVLSDLCPERVSLGRERLEQFTEALKRLPSQRRRFILLNRVEGLTCEEIGRRFGMTGPAVQKQIERALAECMLHMTAIDEARDQ